MEAIKDSSKISSMEKDLEKTAGDYAHLTNTSVRSFGWEEVTVNVKDRTTTKKPKTILRDVSGFVKAGEMLAIMGPSGSGKTTLLNVLAHRDASSKATVESSMFLNGKKTSLRDFRKISSYVEQDDALVGSLTVQETMYFAAQLSLPSSVNKTERKQRIEALIAAFGLQAHANSLIGTPIQKGLSGGQKRRVSVASQLITSPKILFLDEPTSGLDSQAAFEVMSFVKNIATAYKIVVVASIHQPSTATFTLFDKLLLLSCGETAYNGPVAGVRDYFTSIGYEMPQYTNPAEYIIELVNTDFMRDRERATSQLQQIRSAWSKSNESSLVAQEIEFENTSSPDRSTEFLMSHHSANPGTILAALLHRNFIKSYRDVIAYGIRIAMYMGLAILMGTVWLRLSPNQKNIESFTNSIFYGGAFMSFMAVAYVPAYIEDRSIFVKERQNGLYGPTAFIIANFLTGLLPLFIISLLFSVLVYWLSNFRPSADGFWIFVMWLFLDLVAAEGLVVLITNICPIFVVALAAIAFANGLWMSVDGFMVQPHTLNPFWRYVFHYIDYQAYVFQGMMVNEFGRRTYDCQSLPGGGCQCMYASPLQDQCQIAGTAVLDSYGYRTDRTGLWIGILIAIIAGYRILGWAVMYLKRH